MLPFLLCHQRYQGCGFDREIMNHSIRAEKLISEKSLKAGSRWEQIRIQFDYRYLDGTKTDIQMCTRAGQTVKWQGKFYRCAREDVLTYSQIRVIKETFDNVKSYLTRLLKVTPLTQSFKLESNDYFIIFDPEEIVSNVDLYMVITARPRNADDSTLASANYLLKELTYHRPVLGGVYLNPRKIPKEAQSENTWHNEFFYTCVHEIFHALGVAITEFRYYHPYESLKPHRDPLCELTYKGKKMTFLTTPYARKYAKKHYGVTEFRGDNGKVCPAGIELEDTGGSGTAGSHLEERTFMSEMMTGITIQTQNGPFNRLTDAIIAILQDSGNYKVDYTLGQPLIWGHPESIDGRHIPNFGSGPWQLVFPEGYVYNQTYDHFTGFDFKFFGPAELANKPYCSAFSRDYFCEAKGFFDPVDGDIGPDMVFDFMPFKYPNFVCEKGKAMIPSNMQDGRYQKCGEYVCNGYSSFTWRNYNDAVNPSHYETVTCDGNTIGRQFVSNINAGRGYYYRRTLTCPDPERFCRTMKLYEAHFQSDPFDDDYLVLEPRTHKTPTPKPSTPTPKPPTPKPSTPTPKPEAPKTEEPIPDPTPIWKVSDEPDWPIPEKPTHFPTPDEKEIEDPDFSSNSDEQNSQTGKKQQNKKGSGKTTIIIIVAVVAGVLIVAAVVGTVLYIKFKKPEEAGSGNLDEDQDAVVVV